MGFEVIHHDQASHARAGRLTTAHGVVDTPIFMPVGTAGTVKALHFRDLYEDIKAPLILGNTYHLYLRPGLDVLRSAGGLHGFNGWDRSILTDSGGYQVYSLSAVRKMSEEGVTFHSHVDGSRHFFTPENVIDTQRVIGADIIMAFDECTPWPCDKDYAAKSMELTHRWLDRCLRRFDETDPLYGYSQMLFPIVQGSTYADLRERSAAFIAAKDAPGNAIGGLAVGEPAEEMYRMIELVNTILPKDKPRYLMGVGTPVNILESIALGIDMFDCVMPTRNGRNGMIFTRNGIMNMRNQKWQQDHGLLDPGGPSFVDESYSRAFVRHLFVSGEILGPMIASQHNLAFYLWLVREARSHILHGDFSEWMQAIKPQLAQRL